MSYFCIICWACTYPLHVCKINWFCMCEQCININCVTIIEDDGFFLTSVHVHVTLLIVNKRPPRYNTRRNYPYKMNFYPFFYYFVICLCLFVGLQISIHSYIDIVPYSYHILYLYSVSVPVQSYFFFKYRIRWEMASQHLSLFNFSLKKITQFSLYIFLNF